MVFGEITTKANVNYEQIVRKTCREIGFISDDAGIHADKCRVLVNIEHQSPDIAQGVHGHLSKRPEEIGAGDQGHMFGYAMVPLRIHTVLISTQHDETVTNDQIAADLKGSFKPCFPIN